MADTLTITGCLVIRDATALRWLGHQQVWQWCLKSLLEVRNIGPVVTVISSPDILDQIDPGEPEHIQMLEVSAEVLEETTLTLGKRCRANISHLVLLHSATLPFLMSGKLEACAGQLVLAEAPAPCAAMTCAQPDGSTLAAVEHVLAANLDLDLEPTALKPVRIRVDQIEALDVRDSAHWRIAQALVQNGTV